ncbi:MAG: hypothetical protein ACP5EN_16475 [Rhodovulum sp.]
MAIGLLGFVGAAAYAALAACRIDLPVLSGLVQGHCRSDAALDNDRQLALLRASNAALLREIREVENEIAKLQCEAVYEAPPPPEPPVPPVVENEAPVINEEAWKSGDLRVLDGCWELDSDFQTRNIQTGRITHYTRWEMCFDRNGNGRETMTATDGTTCKGAVFGKFLDVAGPRGQQRLEVREPGNLQCSNGSYIHQRIITCELVGDGTALCSNFQPETGGRGEVRLRRRAGN